MDHEDHLKFYNAIKDIAAARFLEDNNIPPTIFYIKSGEIKIHLITSMSNVNEKNIVEKLMVKLINDGAESLCFITEIWALKEKHIHTRTDYPDIQSNPNRSEALMLKYSSQRLNLTGMAFIIRKDTDPLKKPTLSEWEDIKGTSEGRFCNLWEKARSLHFQEN